MFMFRPIFIITLVLSLSNGAAARTFLPCTSCGLTLMQLHIVLGPLWHYAMIAEGPDGELSAVPVISATTTIESPALNTPTASNSSPVVTSIITAAVEQSATDTSPGSKETNTVGYRIQVHPYVLLTMFVSGRRTQNFRSHYPVPMSTEACTPQHK